MDLTEIQLAIIFCAYFFGVFSCRTVTRLFEVSHAAKIAQDTIYNCLLMSAKIHEDVEFVREVKYKYLKKAGFEPEKIKSFVEVDDRTMDNWKESVIRNIIISSPPHFSFMVKFGNWGEALKQLQEMHDDRNR